MADMPKSSSLDKGKGRATAEDIEAATERTPLLVTSQSSSRSRPEQNLDHLASEEHNARRTQSLCSRLVLVFALSLTVCLAILIILLILAYSAAALASDRPEQMIDRGLTVAGPYHVDIINTTSNGGIWVQLGAKVGFDAAAALQIAHNDNDDIFTSARKAIVRTWLEKVGSVAVDLGDVQVYHKLKDLRQLAVLSVPALSIPLTVSKPTGESWLKDVSWSAYFKPTSDQNTLTSFAQGSWADGYASLHVEVSKVTIDGGNVDDNSWRKKMHIERDNIQQNIDIKVPSIPGLPLPGKHSPFPPLSDLITLEAFSVTSANETLNFYGRVNAINPLPSDITFKVPSLPFSVAIAPRDANTSFVDVATLRTSPFAPAHPNMTIHITGTPRTPIPRENTDAISSFLNDFLSQRPAPITVSTPLLPNLSISAAFPPPAQRPRILRDVTIRDMKLRALANGTFVASGEIFAIVTLPTGMHVDVSVTRVWPEVLVFDGEVPDTVPNEIPDPLPEGAFGHIKPPDWLLSRSIPIEWDGGSSAFEVTANVTDIPLEILPGRKREFSNFVSKVIFGTKGAVAGIIGSTAVAVSVEGISSDDDLQLKDLPFRGKVDVGKKTM